MLLLRSACRLCVLARALRWYSRPASMLTKQPTASVSAEIRRLLHTVEKSKKRSGSKIWRGVTRHRLTCTLVLSATGAGWILSGGNFRQRLGLSLAFPLVHCQNIAVIKPAPRKNQQKTVVKESWFSRVYFGLLLWLQFIKVCLMFGPLLFLYPLTFLSASFYKIWLHLLFHAVQRCGPVYIKLGQWASTRRDLFSPEFCQLFSRLHSTVQPHNWRHTERALLKAYGKRWHEVIKLDKMQQPLGSGCIAQVYKGYVHIHNLPADSLEAMEDTECLADLYFKDGVEIHSLAESWSFADDGDVAVSNPQPESSLPYADDPNYVAVAVKVVHPDAWRQLRRDLMLMQCVARVLETVLPSLHWVSLSQCVKQFSIALTKQMDMVHEALCLKRFHTNFADMPSIRIPVPFMTLVRRNILVESFEEGQPIGDFISSKDTPAGLKEKLAELGVDALLHMVFVKNFVHGDLHPGNILVQNASAFTQQTEGSLVMVDVGDVVMATVSPRECPVRLVLLDCGITATLSPDDRDKFTQVFTAVIKGQGEVVADLFLERSHHMECKDPQAFRRDMSDLVNTARQTTLQLSKLKVTELLSDVFSVLSRHHIQLESNFATLMLAMGIVEGLGRSLDPHLDILSKASTVLLGEALHGHR